MNELKSFPEKIIDKRKKALVEWMNELVFDKQRDERVLYSVWNNLRAIIEKEIEQNE